MTTTPPTSPGNIPPRSPTEGAPRDGTQWLIPIGRSPLAFIAGYLALFSVLLLPAPIALFVGILAVRDIRRHPGHLGMGRAVFAIVMGVIFSALLAMIVLGPLVERYL